MLNLFKKQTKPVETSNEVVVLQEPKPIYNGVIGKIHKEFDEASDILLNSAYETLRNLEIKDKDKAERLKKVGFTLSNQVQKADQLLNTQRIQESLAKTIEYYRSNYPNNKFITREDVVKICQKYGLVYGEISRYKGFVPENNLRDVENFRVLDKDCLYTYSDIYSGRTRSISYETYIEYKKGGSNSEKQSPIICAPLKDMNLDSRDVIKNSQIVKQEIPDPVVLQPVDQGFLVITAWGDEENDPIIKD